MNPSNNMHDSMIELDKYMKEIIGENLIPGAVLLAGINEQNLIYEAYGYKQKIPKSIKMLKDDIFDIASLTKVISTLPAILLLISENKISLEDPISKYFEHFDIEDCPSSKISIKEILTHTSGVVERTYLKQYGSNYTKILEGILKEPLEYEPGTRVTYCNRGYILLGELVSIVSGESLDSFITKRLWEKLDMNMTFYNPPSSHIDKIASTEYRKGLGYCLRGVVHDENAQWLGGVAGHAGVFSTASDLARYIRFLLNGGRINNQEIIESSLFLKSFSNLTSELNDSRGLGWQIIHEEYLQNDLIAHTGFTGTSVYINLVNKSFIILLTNRIHPSRENQNIKEVRERSREIFFKSIL